MQVGSFGALTHKVHKDMKRVPDRSRHQIKTTETPPKRNGSSEERWKCPITFEILTEHHSVIWIKTSANPNEPTGLWHRRCRKSGDIQVMRPYSAEAFMEAVKRYSRDPVTNLVVDESTVLVRTLAEKWDHPVEFRYGDMSENRNGLLMRFSIPALAAWIWGLILEWGNAERSIPL